MLKFLLKTTLLLLILALTTTESFAQNDIQVLNDGTLNMGSWGAAFSTNLYSSSYIGFNLKKLGAWQSAWGTFSDGANNGASGIIGGIAGSLMFFTAPTSQPSNGGTAIGQTFQDANMSNMVRMVLNENGQLRLGVRSPSTQTDYKLAVDGKIVAQSLYVTNPNTWADFVFTPSFKLMSLTELEDYLKINHHLPAVPIADKVLAEGYNVTEMDAKLLQSIEELTLHVIELSKQNVQLQSEMTALRQRVSRQTTKLNSVGTR